MRASIFIPVHGDRGEGRAVTDAPEDDPQGLSALRATTDSSEPSQWS